MDHLNDGTAHSPHVGFVRMLSLVGFVTLLTLLLIFAADSHAAPPPAPADADANSQPTLQDDAISYEVGEHGLLNCQWTRDLDEPFILAYFYECRIDDNVDYSDFDSDLTKAVRWTGYLSATTSGDYSLEVYVPDQSGARLWVNQTQVIDQWEACATSGCTYDGIVTLPTAGWYPLVLEYRTNHQSVGFRRITLGWRKPTQPITVEHEVIPNEYLATDYAEPHSSTIIDSTFPGVSDLHAADLDNDGDLDVIGTAQGSADIAWWSNDGTDTFTKHLIKGDFNGASAIATADLNGDDTLDIVAAARYINTIAWWPNDGNASFTTFYTITTDFEEPFYVQTIDMDQDGNTDIMGIASTGSGDAGNPQHTAWWRNDGQGTFTYNHMYNCEKQQDGYAGDMDGDGDVDTVGFASYYPHWWQNIGNESFSSTMIAGYHRTISYSILHAEDFGNDGDQDVLVGQDVLGLDYEYILLYENDGLQNFTRQLIRGGATDVSEVFATDMDDDGDMDVVAAVTGLNQLLWYEKIDHVWFEHKLATAFVGIKTFAVGDFNGDGGVDVVAGGGNTIKLIQTQRYTPPEVSFSSATYTAQDNSHHWSVPAKNCILLS